jgi:hypothetical protein
MGTVSRKPDVSNGTTRLRSFLDLEGDKESADMSKFIFAEIFAEVGALLRVGRPLGRSPDERFDFEFWGAVTMSKVENSPSPSLMGETGKEIVFPPLQSSNCILPTTGEEKTNPI